MKHIKAGKILIVAMVCAFACMSLFACSASDESAEKAEANRQYMALLNSEMADMQTVMDDFETAVSEENVVAMRSQLDKATEVLATIEESQATEDLSETRDQYVNALVTLNDAMDEYVDLFAGVQDGSLSSQDLEEGLEGVQEKYDSGIEKLKAADEAVAKLGQED